MNVSDPRDPNPGPDEGYQSPSYKAMQLVFKSFGVVARAAVLPFGLSVAFVVLARVAGPPERWFLDGLHGLVVISYLTAMIRVGAGTYPGLNIMTLAVPRPSVDDFSGLVAILKLFGESLLLILPAVFLMFLLSMYIGPLVMMSGSLVVGVAAMLIPEFVITTLLGLVFGAGSVAWKTQSDDDDI